MTSAACEEPTVVESLRFGAIFSETGTAADLTGLMVAAEELNAAGVLDQPIEIISSPYSDQTDRAEQAKSLVDNDGVLGIITQFSSTALAVLQVTNTTDYENIVQCSGNSTNTTINNPATADIDGLPGADQNDTLYRTCANDIVQALVVYQQVEDRAKAALFTIDDVYGVSFRTEIRRHAGDTALVIDEVIATDANQANLEAAADQALAANRAGTVDSVIIAGLVEHAGPMIKRLVEATPPYAGAIIIPDGGVENGTFLSQTSAFTTWLGVAGNSLRGTAPDGGSGTHSAAWRERFVEASGDEGLTPFTPTYADCLYSMLIGLAQGTADGAEGAAAVKAGMPKQKLANLTGDVVDVGPTADGLADALAAIDAGSAVRLDGASGLIEYDVDGDRAAQNFAIFAPTGTGPYEWVADEVWDPTIGGCVASCDD